jgi:AAA15 family ATPase/GTPase
MITNIEIQNFRCFDRTKIEGFDRVNLIGGKNNSGKTALLEALIVTDNPENILYLKNLRQEPIEISQARPKQSIENLFFRQTLEQEILIEAHEKIDPYNKISITYHEYIPEKLYEGIDLQKIPPEILSYPKGFAPALEFTFQYGNSEAFKFRPSVIIVTPKMYIKTAPKGHFIRSLSLELDDYDTLPIIPTYSRKTYSEIAYDYESLTFQDQENEHKILMAFQVLDPSIEKIESFSIGSPNLYLTKKGGKRLPIALFGDAINRLARIVLKLLNNNSSILLIDEIENGIHYTNQREFWRMLFRLAIELDTQIFATTHSLEMIRAFADVGLEYYPDRGAYFELTKSQRTDKIIGVKWELELLDYTLNNQGRVRGETLEDVRKSTNEHKE